MKLEGWVVVEVLAAAFACAALWTLARPSSSKVGPCPSLAALPDAMVILLTLGCVVAIVLLVGFARSLAWLGSCFQLDAGSSEVEGCDAATLDATALAAIRFQQGTS